MPVQDTHIYHFFNDSVTSIGCNFGTVVTLSISGWLTQTSLGWPSVFYVFGMYGLVWSFFWFKFAYDTPDEHPTISHEEKLYIKSEIGEHRGKKVSCGEV